MSDVLALSSIQMKPFSHLEVCILQRFLTGPLFRPTTCSGLEADLSMKLGDGPGRKTVL